MSESVQELALVDFCGVLIALSESAKDLYPYLNLTNREERQADKHESKGTFSEAEIKMHHLIML